MSTISIASGARFIGVIGITIALVIVGAIALGVGNTPRGRGAESTCALQLTNWFSLPLPAADYQSGLGGNLPTLLAFAEDPALASWLRDEQAKFYPLAATRSVAVAFVQLQTDTLNKCAALATSGFKIATIPIPAS